MVGPRLHRRNDRGSCAGLNHALLYLGLCVIDEVAQRSDAVPRRHLLVAKPIHVAHNLLGRLQRVRNAARAGH